MSLQTHPVESPPAAAQSRRRRGHRVWAAAVVVVVVAGCVGAAVWGWGSRHAAAPSAIPTFAVEPGTVQIIAYAKGTLQGGQADRLMAPTIGGDMPRISFLLPAGTEVKPGEVVLRFNTGQEAFNLAQARNAAAQAQANIAAARDQVKAQGIQDTYALEHAHSEVKLAQIAVRTNPLLAALDARDNLLTLQSAQAELKQLESDISKRQASSQGLIDIQLAAAAKAQAQAAAAQGYIASMTLRAARAGYVAIETNERGTGMIYQGMMLPPFHVGDQVSPGGVVAEIPNLDQLQMQARLSEAGSAYVAVGQTAEVQVAGLPGRVFSAHVVRLAGRQAQMFSAQQSATCVLALAGSDSTLRPGMDAKARIVLSRMQHVLWVPVEALFHQNGQAIVYVLGGGTFSPQPVKVLRQGPTRVAISGIAAGTRVALSDPAGTADGGQQP